jgi:hypothetical protein
MVLTYCEERVSRKFLSIDDTYIFSIETASLGIDMITWFDWRLHSEMNFMELTKLMNRLGSVNFRPV